MRRFAAPRPGAAQPDQQRDQVHGVRRSRRRRGTGGPATKKMSSCASIFRCAIPASARRTRKFCRGCSNLSRKPTDFNHAALRRTGLGLAISKRLVHGLMGGTIRVHKRRRGKGQHSSVSRRNFCGRARSDAKSVRIVPESTSRANRALVVDDNAKPRASPSPKFSRNSSSTCTSVASERAALEEFQTRPAAREQHRLRRRADGSCRCCRASNGAR